MSKSKSSSKPMRSKPSHNRFGCWNSPLTADRVAQQQNSIQDLIRCNDQLLWLKALAEENGRLSVFSLPDAENTVLELSPPPLNVRSKVHEYGGAACLYTGQCLYVSNFSDQRLYEITLSTAKSHTATAPRPVTVAGPYRYADAIWDAQGQRIICVMEEHSSSEHTPVNCLISLDPSSGQCQKLAQGADFYAAPRLSPDGTRLCWLSWNHPYMPWDSTYLWLAEFEQGVLSAPQLIAGSDQESIVQATWSPQGVLHFISDRSDYWNLYCYQNKKVEICYEGEEELSKPMWVLGLHTYDFCSNDEIVTAYTRNSEGFIGLIDKDQTLKPLAGPYPIIKNLHVINDEVFFIAGHSNDGEHIYRYRLKQSELTSLVSETINPAWAGYISTPKSLRFAASDNSQLSGFYYPPTNKDYDSSDASGAPPLIIKTHGGPTSSASAALDLAIQFWTSRGFALFDLNYRGSCGYGRAYRRALYGQWGVADVDDCVTACHFLIQAGLADAQRLIIRGSSAGGYCTLAALTFSTLFKAGTSYYGISDLKSLALGCHKFESHYVQQLLNEEDLTQPIYQQRSPLFHVDKLHCPILFFQGALDKVVPPEQAQKMVKALQDNNIDVAYYEFENEAHGFRQHSTLKTTLELEWAFYKRVLAL